MPFTFAHPAIILPFGTLKRFPVSMSALVIGSVTPDFEYFIRMKLTGRYSHSIEGMFILDLPVAIMLLLVFHQLVKVPLIDNLPQYFSGRLHDLRQFDLLKYLTANYHTVVFCLLLGIGSHILWDSFTHSNEYFVDRFEVLKTPFSFLGALSMPLYRWLQHASTAFGFMVIGIVFHNRQVQQSGEEISIPFWILATGIAFISFVIRSSLGFEYYGDVVATAISASCIGLIGSSLAMRWYHG